MLIATYLVFFVQFLVCTPLKHIGTLYNCSISTSKGILAFPTTEKCNDNKKEVKEFKGQVLKYEPESTGIKVFHCKAYKDEDICREFFFGQKIHIHKDAYIKISLAHCKYLIKNRQTKLMKLTDGSGSFISRSVAHADCHWMKTTKISAPIYRLDTYTAYIEAGNDLLH